MKLHCIWIPSTFCLKNHYVCFLALSHHSMVCFWSFVMYKTHEQYYPYCSKGIMVYCWHSGGDIIMVYCWHSGGDITPWIWRSHCWIDMSWPGSWVKLWQTPPWTWWLVSLTEGYFGPFVSSPLIGDWAYVSRTLCSVLSWFEVQRNKLDLTVSNPLLKVRSIFYPMKDWPLKREER